MPTSAVSTRPHVVVVGGGSVAQRRVPVLIEAGARVVVVSPQVTPALEGMADEVTLVLREFTESDLDETWYAIAATDQPDVNARVLAAADERRIFCVRADDAREASAWTMASGRHGQVTVAVLGTDGALRITALVIGNAIALLAALWLVEGDVAAARRWWRHYRARVASARLPALRIRRAALVETVRAAQQVRDRSAAAS